MHSPPLGVEKHVVSGFCSSVAQEVSTAEMDSALLWAQGRGLVP